MKKAVLFLVLSLSAFGLRAQEVQKDYVFISLTHFFESTYLLSYERFNDSLNRSVHISGGMIARGGEEENKFGGMVSLQRRFYFIEPDIHRKSIENGSFLQGIYFAPYATYKYVDAKTVTYQDIPNSWENDTVTTHIRSHSIQGGIVVGLQFSMSDVIYVDTYFGGGIRYAGRTEEHLWDLGAYPITYNGVMVKGGVSIGFKL